MIGAYHTVKDFAYPGWRLTVPGGPAGGHYKGFTHTQAAGTDIPPNDQYEQDREDGMSSHDAVHASPRNPRGVYRSSAEVPPRPNASGSAMTYRGYQTQRHPGTSVAPGSFPADYFETPEDLFLKGLAEVVSLEGLGAVQIMDGNVLVAPFQARPAQACAPVDVMVRGSHWDAVNCRWVRDFPGAYPITHPIPPATGATSVVNQPSASPLPPPPSPSVPVVTAPPVSPTPAPIVATNEVVPLNDGSGNYVNVSTGAIVPASAVTQNPATGQLTASMASSALSWLEQNSIWSAVPNWGVLAGGLFLASMMFKGKR
jgi:hypothetical protein